VALDDIGGAIVNEYEFVNSETIVQFLGQLREKYPQNHKAAPHLRWGWIPHCECGEKYGGVTQY
jgi:hypothetical protein